MIGIKQSAGVAALLLVLSCWGIVAGAEMVEDNVTVSALTSQPVQFIKNVGQSPEMVQYQARSQNFAFDFTTDGLVISGTVPDALGMNESGVTPLIVSLEGADPQAGIEALDQLPGYANFLIGQNESEYRSHVPWFGAIRYSEILPGISLTYSGADGVLKREYLVSPGADPASIRLTYEGAEAISLADDGSLIVRTPFGNLTEAAPVSYQETGGTRVNVSSSYLLMGEDQIGFTLGTYDPSLPLVIDPYLEYSTYLGGALEDYGMDIAMDTQGSAYVVGYTSSCNFPLVRPINVLAPIEFNGTFCHNSRDVFVTKINQTAGGNATIEFSTYIGGFRSDIGTGIAIDSLKDIYITGFTDSEDFPVMLPIQNGGRLHGSTDAFVTKIRSDGANFWYSSYLGGNFRDESHDIALDSLNAAYITGITVGNNPYKKPEDNFPTTSGAFQTAPNTNAVMGDAFVSKISPTGNSLEYSSYLSGRDQDSGNGIAVDGQGRAYIVGTTTSDNLVPPSVPGKQKVRSGAQDAFLFRMNLVAGTPPDYATYLGGATGYDYGEAVAVDKDFCAYVTGATASTDFPYSAYAKQKTKGWPYDFFETDAFVTKFSASGTDHEYSTYLGGSDNEWGYGIAVDRYRRAYVTGSTKSESFPRLDSIKSVIRSGDQDGFLTCVNEDGSNWVYSTVFGGYLDETSHGVATSIDGNTTLVTGWTNSPSILDLVSGTNCFNDCFPVMKWINQNTYPAGSSYVGGNHSGSSLDSSDAFVMKFGRSNLLPSFSPDITCGNADLTVLFTDTSGSSANIVQRIWNFGDGNVTSFGSAPVNVPHTYTTPGTYPVTLSLYSYSGSAISSPVTINVCKPDISANYSMPGFNTSVDPVHVPWKTSITFTGSANFTPSMWDWDFDDSSANVTGQTVARQFAIQRLYNVTMTARSGGCCGNVSVLKHIQAVAPPYAEFANQTLSDRLYICPEAEVIFEDLSYDDALHGAPTAWLWDFGDGKTSTEQNPTHQYLHSGTYTVTLTVSNAAGTSMPRIKPGYVIVTNEVDAGFTADVRTGHAPLTVNFTDRSTGYPMYWRWDFGDGSPFVSTRNATHTYQNVGRFYVNLTAWSNCGAPDFSNLTEYITINGNVSPTILFSKTNSGYLPNPINGTNPLMVYFQGNTSRGYLIDEFWWDFGDGNVTEHQTRDPFSWPSDNSWVNTSHQYSAIGDYTPVLQVYNNTWPGWNTTGHQYDDYVGVYCPLVANFTSPLTGVVGQPLRFTDTTVCEPSGWEYSFGDGNFSYEQNPIHAYSRADTYHVWLNATNKYGFQNHTAPRNIVIGPGSAGSRILFVPQEIQMVAGMSSARKVQVLLERADFGLSSYTIQLDLDNTTTSNFYAVVERPGWIDSDKFAYNALPAGKGQYLTISAWNSTGGVPVGSVNVSLGNLTLVGSAAGNNIMRLNSSSIAQYGASFMSLTHLPAAIHSYQVSPLPGFSQSPSDLKPDGQNDGLVDDFDGNGVVNANDVTVFFRAWSAGSLQSAPVAPYDYNHNGRIDTDDIVEFFDVYSHW